MADEIKEKVDAWKEKIKADLVPKINELKSKIITENEDKQENKEEKEVKEEKEE